MNEEIMNDLSVKIIKDFGDYLTPEANEVYSNIVHTTGSVYQVADGKEILMPAYIQKCVEFAPYEEEIRMNEGIKWLADYFNKAVRKGLIGYGVLMPASQLNLIKFSEMSKERRILFVYPICKLTDHSPQNLNRLMER